jgi:LPXTG-site transpeptidase (sortase) family protein
MACYACAACPKCCYHTYVKLKHINSLLLTAILVVNVYIVLTPLLPSVWFWWQRQHTPTFAQLNHQVQQAAPPVQAKGQNWLIIPSMLLSQPINEGPDMRALQHGPWRLPHTSTPSKGGNTVIVGHRYTYTNPRGAFYQLDKVRTGDEIGIYWQAKRYRYKVIHTEVVPPTQLSVEAPTKQSQLTLYTCTPLWWPKNRLVVTAQLENTK